MLKNEEQQALRIDEALNKNQASNNPDDAPYLRMAKALKAHALSDNQGIDSEIKKSQKEHLLQMAKNIKKHRVEIAEQKNSGTKQDKEKGKKPWWIWFGSLATVSAAVLLLFVTQTGKVPFKNLSTVNLDQYGLNALSLIVPEAHAGDAFSMLAEKQDQSGVEVDSGFRIQSKIPIDKQTLSQNLRLIQVSEDEEQMVTYSVNDAGQNEYSIKPEQPLSEGSVYKIIIATAIRDEKGELRQRDFSWAIQTKDVFKIIRSVPANASTDVPVDTAIEIMLSQIGWNDPGSYVDIQPPTQGRFEVHGRSLIFLPEKKLDKNTLYTFTYKKGWGIKDGTLKLENDYVIKFQTSDDVQSRRNNIIVPSYLIDSSPGSDPVVSLWATDNTLPIEVTGYSLSYEQALEAIKQIEFYPSWVDLQKISREIISKNANNQILNYTANIEDGRSWNKIIRLPNSLAVGYYAVQLKQQDSDPVWIILQVTNIATYTIADRDKVLTWVINTETGKPLSQLKVNMQDKAVNTDNQGMAYLDTPEDWQSDNGDQEHVPVILEFESNNTKLISVLKYRDGRSWYASVMTDDSEASFNTWAYLYADRPLYRTQDEINIFGLLQDRASGKGAGQVVVELKSYGFLDYSTYQDKIYAKAEMQTDSSGFFNGKLKWNGYLSPGYYNLVLKLDGKEILLRSIEIRDIVKPAYYIDIAPDKSSIYSGENVEGTVTVKFYDGTPVTKSKISLKTYGGFFSSQSSDVTTDDLGKARFIFKTSVPPCNLNSQYVYCSNREYLTIEARPTLGEEGEIFSSISVDVWRGKSNLSSESIAEKDGQAVLRYRARQVDLSLDNGREQDSVLMAGIPGAIVKVRAMEQHWEKKQVGTYFDPIERKSIPRYEYNLREVESGVYEGKTDMDGRVEIKFTMKDDQSYKILASMEDGYGTVYAVTSYVSRGWYDRANGDNPTLENINSQESKNSYRIGEKISIGFLQNGTKVAGDKTSFLFIHASRGLKKASFSSDSLYEVEFSDQDVPNVSIYGIAFINNGFVQAQFDASIDTKDKELQVILEPDKDSYAPGGQVSFKAKVLNKDGSPVSDARLAISVTDEAFLAVANSYYEENPLTTIYRWLPDGIVSTDISHDFLPELAMGAGGAEMGGGGRGASVVRKNFKDQATFITLQTSTDGTANGSFVLPDNITSWRITAMAVSPNLQAGSAKLKISSTKDLFVEAVMPQDVLASDKPVMKLRAFGRALNDTKNIDFIVDVPTLGINNQRISAEPNKPVYLGIDHLVIGNHKAIISIVINDNSKDAIERTLSVVSSRATHDERVNIELAPGSELPDIGQNPEIDLIFESKARGSVRTQLEGMVNPWSARLESVVAGKVTRQLMSDYFQTSGNYDAELSLYAYQKTDGGLSILPYSSAEVGISAKVAASGVEGFDKARLINYLWAVSDDQNSSREEMIQALSGLAALGQPVVQRLDFVLQQQDLSWRESLALIRGLDAIGSREAARSVFEDLLKQATEHDGLMSLNISENQPDVLEATSEAAAIARAIAHPKAGLLANYVDTNWSEDVLTDLDRAMYLQKTVPTLLPIDVKISYAVGSDVKDIDLKNQNYHSVKLTADEAKAFRVVSVNGPASMSFVKRATGDKPQVNKLLSITREYRSLDGKKMDSLQEGDLVRITLSPSWDTKAQDGCYILRDRLPAGFMPVVNIYFDRYLTESLFYPYDFKNGEVSFVTCKQAKPYQITYLARVIAVGSYTAGGALLQSMSAPSVASTSEPISIEVK